MGRWYLHHRRILSVTEKTSLTKIVERGGFRAAPFFSKYIGKFLIVDPAMRVPSIPVLIELLDHSETVSS